MQTWRTIEDRVLKNPQTHKKNFKSPKLKLMRSVSYYKYIYVPMFTHNIILNENNLIIYEYFKVVGIMRVNVEKVLERDQKLSELDNRAGTYTLF